MAEVKHGSGSNEQLVVSTDKTQAYGLSGDDTIISGGNSNVLLIGGSGDDSLVMMGGNGTLNGGAGSDTFELTYSAVNSLSAVIEDFNPSDDKIVVNFEGASAPQLHSVKADDGDVIWQDADGLFNLTLKSKRENDYFDGTGNAENDNRLFEVLRFTNNERENPTIPEAPNPYDYQNESEYNAAYQKWENEKDDQETLVAAAKDLPWLTLTEGLMIGAETRAEEIKELAQAGALSNHKRPDGTDYFTVLVGENLSLSAKYSTYGENLEAGADSPANVTNAWIGSLSHHKNLLDESFTKLGVGYVYDNSYDHEHYWTQLFAGSLASISSISLEGLSIPQVNAVSKVVTLSDDAETYNNTDYGATINALDGNDFISNTGAFVSIAGGSGADTIDNSGANATICAGTGDDSIQLGSDNLIEYRVGDGSDTVSGFDATSRLKIIGDVEYMPVTVDNDVIVSVGGGSITLKDAATLEGIDDYIDGKRKNHFILTNANNTRSYDIDGAIIEALGGNDNITNSGANVSIDAGDGNDTVNNSGDFATISAGTGNDSVHNSGASVLFIYDSGNDTIEGFNETSTLRVSEGNYSTVAIGDDLIIKGATDSIKLLGVAGLSTLNIVDADGNPVEFGNARDIIRTDEDDYIDNDLDDATIQALGGDDTIANSGSNVIINAGAGNDSIVNSGASVLFVYDSGDDTIQGFRADSTLQIAGDDGSSLRSNNDLILTLNTGSITLEGVAGLSTFNIVNANGSPIELRDARNIVGTEKADTINNTIDGATITALGGNDTITNNGNKVTISAGAGNDSVDNQGSKVTIDTGAGDDVISNSKASVSIDAGEGNDSVDNQGSRVTISTGDGEDTITNNGANVTIYSGAGNDFIKNTQQRRVVYIYGGGDDTIEGFNDNALLDLGNYASETEQSGDDVLVYVKSNSETIGTITLKDYSDDPQDNINPKPYSPSTVEGQNISNYTNATILTGTAGDDTIRNSGDSVTIDAGRGSDIIYNDDGNYVTINGGAGNDTFNTWGENTNVSINGGAGNDYVHNNAFNSTIYTGNGNDTIGNWGSLASNVNINSGSGDDLVDNNGNNVTIDTGDGNDTVQNSSIYGGGHNVSISTDDGDDSISNYCDSVTIDSGADDDYIDNEGANVSIDTGEDNDTIKNNGANVTILGNAGDDTIHNEGDSVTIGGGDGRSSIVNGNPYLDASVSGGNNVVITAGADDDFIRNNHGNNVSISSGGGDDLIYVAKASDFTVDMGTGSDTIWNDASNGLVNGGAGNDFIGNNGGLNAYDPSNNMTLNGDDGDDTINNYMSGANVYIDGGAGNDDIDNNGNNSTILGGDGDDTISNSSLGSNVSIVGGEGDDTITNYGDSVTIDCNAGNNEIHNNGTNVIINGGTDAERIFNENSNVTISGGAGKDAVWNSNSVGGDSVSMDGGADDDYIVNYKGDSVTIDGGAGDDTIQNGYKDEKGSLHGGGSNVSILGEKGNDQISLSADSENNFIRYSLGDGNDTVWGMDTNDTLNLLADESLVSSIRSGNDIIYKVGEGSVRLVGAWEKPPHIIIGESGTSGGSSSGGNNGGGSSSGGNGGGSSGGGNGGGSSSGGNGGDNGGNQGSNTSGGGSQNEGKGDTDATQGQSASGSPGRGTSSGRGTSTGISNGGSNNGGSNNGGGYSSRGYNSTDYRRSTTASTPFDVNPFELLKIEARNANQNASTSGNQYIYAGYNQVIDNYQAGEKIFFLTDYTGAFYDGAGNFFFGSSTGALVVQNATDKFIEHYDGNGNSFLKAYAASTAGVIDGRWTTGFEVLNGSTGSDVIFAGDSGSQLFGGTDVVSDTLVGGAGADIFIGGKAQGADIILNASSADVVNLSYVTANDIIATLESDGAITVAFNTGNAIAVQSSESQSATFQLADGSAYRFNHATKTWQNANQHVYAGGNQIITDYQAGEKILFNATYTGATFDNAGNLIVGSSAGALAVTNATDKVIDLRDATGNDFVKAYAATTAGVIDGRGLAGFEVINGSQGSDAIFAGDGGSQLWGGADNAADTLIGGAGSDIFIGGKSQGADVILNASSTDVVHLNDATLSDIIGTTENDGAITLAFNTGNVIAVQSSEVQSATFQLADGSAYRYNHSNKSWQNT